ncbi:uncharacterized protein N7483_010792 [Penicillium malachiteum]|uniref:uncharacterized protein n=1 Tax=Penicillium malachiteum TaxID=1324776 RepID=UPI002548F431|nr:uncharacterized protein N7483_010792 [Penicillium malachiteum]KAJ5713611.1 hypothetical protein N7483_010792 [Penicillium malachiteum]
MATSRVGGASAVPQPTMNLSNPATNALPDLATVDFGLTAVLEVFGDETSKKTLLNIIAREVHMCKTHNEHRANYPDGRLVQLFGEDPSIENELLFKHYITEHIPGMDTANNISQRIQIARACLAAGKAWDEAMQNPRGTGPSNRETQDGAEFQDPNRPIVKLSKVYREALVNYYLADANKSGVSDKATDKFSNVRFLRDTAENLLRTAGDEGMRGTRFYEDVERVRDASCEHAQWLAGGRKRTFDEGGRGNRDHWEPGLPDEENDEQEPPAEYNPRKRRAPHRTGRSQRDRREYYDSYRPQ